MTKSKMLEMIDSGTAFISSYCYMTNKVEAFGCEDCHDYSCCVKNGTADPDASLLGLFNRKDQTFICDLDEIDDE